MTSILALGLLQVLSSCPLPFAGCIAGFSWSWKEGWLNMWFFFENGVVPLGPQATPLYFSDITCPPKSEHSNFPSNQRPIPPNIILLYTHTEGRGFKTPFDLTNTITHFVKYYTTVGWTGSACCSAAFFLCKVSRGKITFRTHCLCVKHLVKTLLRPTTRVDKGKRVANLTHCSNQDVMLSACHRTMPISGFAVKPKTSCKGDSLKKWLHHYQIRIFLLLEKHPPPEKNKTKMSGQVRNYSLGLVFSSLMAGRLQQ